MFDAAAIDVLKYGAFGLGLAIVVYTAVLLKQEMSRDTTRAAASALIVTYMVFGLLVFAGGGYLELKKQGATTDVEMIKAKLTAEMTRADQAMSELTALRAEREKLKAMSEQIGNGINTIDSSLGGKYQVEVSSLPESAHRTNLIYFTDSICRQVIEIKKLTQPGRPATCKIQSR